MNEIFNLSVRERYRIIDKTSIVNVIVNFIIATVKIIIAIVSGSIAVASDSVINIGDTISGLVTLYGNHLSQKKPTKKHPFGFGRIEYLTIIIAAVVMITVSGILMYVSVEHIIHPIPIEINGLEYALLGGVVVAKFFLFYYNKQKSEKTLSGELEAVSHDSFIDAIGTLIVITLIFVDHFFKVELDGYIGLGVGLFITISNIIDIYKTISLMLGTKADPYITDEIKRVALTVPDIENVRNIIIHSYGYNVHFGQMDLDLPKNMDVLEASKKLKELETVLDNKFNISFTFGISPDNQAYKE